MELTKKTKASLQIGSVVLLIVAIVMMAVMIAS